MLLYQLLSSKHPYEEGLLPPAEDSGGIAKSGRGQSFFLPGLKVRVLANKNGGGIKALYHLHGRQFPMRLYALWAM